MSKLCTGMLTLPGDYGKVVTVKSENADIILDKRPKSFYRTAISTTIGSIRIPGVLSNTGVGIGICLQA